MRSERSMTRSKVSRFTAIRVAIGLLTWQERINAVGVIAVMMLTGVLE